MRFILHPGLVYSKDNDCHFISAPQLANLYGVPLKNCYVLDSRRPETYLGYKKRKNDIHLYPRPSGDYNLIIN